MDKLRIGIIGAGTAGTFHASVFNNLPNTKVVAFRIKQNPVDRISF